MEEKQINKIIKKCTIILFIAIIFTWALFNFESVESVIGFIMKILTPFLIGILLALFLNVPMNFFQKKFQARNKKGELKEYKGISLALSVICIILLVLFVVLLILPELINIGKIFTNNIPMYEQKLNEFITDINDKIPNIDITAIKDAIFTNIQNIKNGFVDQLPNMLSSSLEVLTGTINGIVNFFLGMAFAFITLGQKERIKSGCKKLLYTYIKKERADKIVKFTIGFVDNFNKFIVAQCMSALAIGILCVLGSLILQIPYAVQVGVLVGFTSLIPIFGTLIGIIISLILIVFIEPIKALIFFIFTMIVWQLFENLVKPKIAQRKVGISSFWLFVATIAGGVAFGAIGILLAVPITNTIYMMMAERVKNTKVD